MYVRIKSFKKYIYEENVNIYLNVAHANRLKNYNHQVNIKKMLINNKSKPKN